MGFGSNAMGRRLGRLVVALGAGLALTSGALAQDAEKVGQLLEDFIFYTNTANPELALANGRALLDAGVDPQDFVALVEDSPALGERFDKAYRKALRYPELEAVAGELWTMYDDGRRARARDPQEIARNIELLTGHSRARELGRARLLAASEYAVPQLLEVIMTNNDAVLRTEAQRVMIDLGRYAVNPLCAALMGVPPETQETLCVILRQSGYRQALPYLHELRMNTESSQVRHEAERAIGQIDGGVSEATPLSPLFVELADQYLTETRNLTSFPDESHQLLWSYSPGLGLHPTAVYSEVYHEAMAMQLSESALQYDEGAQGAVSTWLLANFKRANEQPEDYDNPAYGPERREAMYYAVVAGSAPVQRVLARSLADRNTRVARQAIDALSRSTGGAGLWQGLANERPLVSALGYPDRRVKYEASLALAQANPGAGFEGADRVVPTLASIIRDADKRYALVLARSVERQQELRGALEEAGYTVAAPASNLNEAQQSIVDLPGVDVIVSDVDGEAGLDIIDSVRRSSRLEATPVVALMPFDDLSRYAVRLQGDGLTFPARDGISSSELQASVEQAVTKSSGAPVDAEAARAYADRALAVLLELASGSSPVYRISDAAPALLSALGESKGGVMLRVADILSRIGEKRAQVALMDAALRADGFEQVALLRMTTDSAKRYGNLLDERQVRQAIELSDALDEELATTAAALVGALNLPNNQIVPLILGN